MTPYLSIAKGDLSSVGTVHFIAANFNPPNNQAQIFLSSVGTLHILKQDHYMYRSYGTQKQFVHCTRRIKIRRYNMGRSYGTFIHK